MENCLGGQMATGSCGQSCRGVTGGGPWRQGSWAGGCSIIPASVTWLLVRPELRNSPNMSRRNISRWRAATKNQIIIILLLVFDGVWMAWVIIDRERAMVHEDLGFSILTL